MPVTFTAVVTSHANERGLINMLAVLRYQTRPTDQTIVMCSDTRGVEQMRHDFTDVTFIEEPNQNDWGHTKRRNGTEHATGNWVGWFNDDDTYDPHYLETMLKHAGHADVVYCDWNENPDATFQLFRSTAGNFIVKTEIAKKVGWPTGRHEVQGFPRGYCNDGIFIQALTNRTDRIVKAARGPGGRLLYTHH